MIWLLIQGKVSRFAVPWHERVVVKHEMSVCQAGKQAVFFDGSIGK